MRMIIGLLAALSIGASSPTLAADPPPADATKSATQETSATTSESAAASKTATASANGPTSVRLIAGDAAAEARLKKLKAAGYKPEMRNGEVVFCRRETQLGTRFEKKVCNTVEQLDARTASSQETTDGVQRRALQGSPTGH